MTAGHRHTVFWLIGFALFFPVPMAAVIGVLVRFALAQYLASPVYDPANSKPTVGAE